MRDLTVTGVQPCALPISARTPGRTPRAAAPGAAAGRRPRSPPRSTPAAGPAPTGSDLSAPLLDTCPPDRRSSNTLLLGEVALRAIGPVPAGTAAGRLALAPTGALLYQTTRS